MIAATVIALAFANTPLSRYYDIFLAIPMTIRISSFEIAKPLLLWMNDGLMAVFFFLIGLELKREFVSGELSSIKKIALPAAGAAGGMIVPALIYTAFNHGDSAAMKGWAIPAATDIAFSLGILSLLGKRVPAGMKTFLASLAIFDDLAAIVIIAFFYTTNISFQSLAVAICCLPVLFIMNKKGVTAKSFYLAVGAIMWAALLKSGVHATLAGVALAMFIPMTSKSGSSPLRELEGDLHSLVSFIILPLFAFCNTGVRLIDASVDMFLHPVPVGIAAGLFIGKQAGIFSFCVAAYRFRIAALPAGATWRSLYGTAILCGIGFTMSLFIGSLAFEESGVNLIFDERIGILTGSLLSAIAGYLVLHFSLPHGDPSSH